MSSTVPSVGAAGQAAANPPPPLLTQYYHTSKSQVPLLTPHNYPIWSKSLQLILRAEKLWQIVDGIEQAPDLPIDDNAPAPRSSRAAGSSSAGPSSAPARASARSIPLPDQQAEFTNRQKTRLLPTFGVRFQRLFNA